MCGRLVNLDTVARVLAGYYHLKTETQLAALDEALSKVPAVSVGGGHGKDHIGDPTKMVGDSVSRQAAIDKFEPWLKVDGYSEGELNMLKAVLYELRVMPPAQPQPEIKRCKDCKHWRDSDGVYRRGTGAESKCPLNTKEVYAGTFYCGYAERRTDE